MLAALVASVAGSVVTEPVVVASGPDVDAPGPVVTVDDDPDPADPVDAEPSKGGGSSRKHPLRAASASPARTTRPTRPA